MPPASGGSGIRWLPVPPSGCTHSICCCSSCCGCRSSPVSFGCSPALMATAVTAMGVCVVVLACSDSTRIGVSHPGVDCPNGSPESPIDDTTFCITALLSASDGAADTATLPGMLLPAQLRHTPREESHAP